MVDRDQEILNFIKRRDVRTAILHPEFPEEYYNRIKTEYFSVFLRNKIGKPRDPEVAKAALDHLFREHYFKSRDHLDEILQRRFFSKNIFEPKFYLQKFSITAVKEGMDSRPIGNQRSKEEVKDVTQEIDQKIKEVSQVEDKKNETEITWASPNDPLLDRPAGIQKPGEELKDTTQKIEEKVIALESISSELDQAQNITEPSQILETKDAGSGFDPWWMRLRLTSNPFPDTDGLGTIAHSLPKQLYDGIVIKTEVFQRYIHYINKIPSELFKNTIFYGEFGSGKTTFFDYLQIPLVRCNIHPAMIGLSPESSDYQSFLMQFKKKLSTELINIFYKLTGAADVSASLESLPPSETIAKVIKLIEKTGRCNGFLVFVDNIYKPQDYDKVAFKFLNYLQTFTAELKKQMTSPNIGFFISAPPHWEPILNDNQTYSGSVTSEVHMPEPTVEQVTKMFNDRLAAFAITKEKSGYIGQEFAQQIIHTLKLRKAFTFRNFIKDCLRRFESGDFGCLIANPALIDDTTLRNIKQLLKENLTAYNGIDEILTSSMSQINKAECFRILVRIFLEKKIMEDSDTFQKKKFHFNELKNAGLIIKNSSFGKTSWSVSHGLANFELSIKSKYGFSLEDYFLKLFEKRLELKFDKSISDKKESTLTDEIIAHLRNKNDGNSSPVISFLDMSLARHKQIVNDINRTADRLSFDRFKKECRASLILLSNAVATYANLSTTGIEFWKDFWHYPDNLDYFLKVLETQSSENEPSNVYLFSAYESAYIDIVSFLWDQIKKDDVMAIPVTGLKKEEIRKFDKARIEYCDFEYISAARTISSLVETKLREFIYSVFYLQHGEYNNRIQRIPIALHSTILEHIKKDKERGLSLSENELTYLNRQHYYGIIAAEYGIGNDNWIHTFRITFAGWSIGKVRSYLDMFYKLNLPSAHNKEEVLTKIHQSDVYQYIVDSIRLIVMINKSYFMFINSVKKTEIAGSTENEYYFTLDEDKYSVQPVRVSSENRKRIIGMLEEPNTIDLSSVSEMQQRYHIGYRELFAILSDLLRLSTPGIETKVIKMNEPVIVLKVK
jgi:hypothetical protein